MAQPRNPIRFDPHSKFYMCRCCQNHVLSGEHNIFKDTDTGVVVCDNPANVRVESELSDHLGSEHPLLNLTCNDCRTSLGGKLVGNIVDDETFMFFLEELLYWNGSELVYADTEQPVDEDH